MVPEKSLALLKATAQVAHEGGKRFATDSPEHAILARWIEAGVAPPDASAPLVTELVRYLEGQFRVRLACRTAAPQFAWTEPAAENFIDEYVFARLRQLKLNPAGVASDSVFLRRVYLDLLGVLPTAEEARAFLADPITDQTLPTLLDDLEDRGLLDETLVVWMGEFGRTPKINKNVSRDHWPQCYTTLLAGGGVKRGYVYGASDANGMYPAKHPVRPEDLAATIYSALGIDPGTEVYDRGNRPLMIAGNPVTDVFA